MPKKLTKEERAALQYCEKCRDITDHVEVYAAVKRGVVWYKCAVCWTGKRSETGTFKHSSSRFGEDLKT